MKITTKTIHHLSQRYNTVGDWIYDEDGNLEILISDMGNWRQEALVAVHELVEALLCSNDGISQLVVDNFDLALPSTDEDIEPGDHPECPYREQHCMATGIERLQAVSFGVDWSKYEDMIEALSIRYEQSKQQPTNS